MDFIFTIHSIFPFPSGYFGSSLYIGTILKGKLIFSFILQVIRSKIPSGGIKVIERSLSNLPSLTHQWNLRSLIEIPRSNFLFFDSFSINNLSFIPNLHSGISLSWHLTFTWPKTSILNTVLVLENRTLRCSIISIKTSFFLYLIPSVRQEVTPVAQQVSYFSF